MVSGSVQAMRDAQRSGKVESMTCLEEECKRNASVVVRLSPDAGQGC